jgi:hypothetical protein
VQEREELLDEGDGARSSLLTHGAGVVGGFGRGASPSRAWGHLSLDVALVSFLLGPRRAFPPRVHDEISESDESAYQDQQHRDTL